MSLITLLFAGFFAGPRLFRPKLTARGGGAGGPSGSGLLLESGAGYVLLENGSFLLLE